MIPSSLQIARGDLQRFGRHFRLRRIAPQNRGATLGRNHRVNRILKHVHLIADGDGQRAARAAFAGDGHDDGHGQARHLAQISRDGFGLAALFGVNARIRSRRIDECENRPAKFRGQLH